MAAPMPAVVGALRVAVPVGGAVGVWAAAAAALEGSGDQLEVLAHRKKELHIEKKTLGQTAAVGAG